MSSIHDYEIDVYTVDFKKKTIVFDVSYNQEKNKSYFMVFFAIDFMKKCPIVSSLIWRKGL